MLVVLLSFLQPPDECMMLGLWIEGEKKHSTGDNVTGVILLGLGRDRNFSFTLSCDWDGTGESVTAFD